MFGILSWFGSAGAGGGTQFTAECKAVIEGAPKEASRLRSRSVDPEHLLLAVLVSPTSDASLILASAGVRSAALLSDLEGRLLRGARPSRRSIRSPSWSNAAKEMVVGAVGEARRVGQAPVSSGHLLLALFKDTGSAVGQALVERGVTAANVGEALRQGVGAAAELDIRIDDRSDQLIYQQVVGQIQEAIATGRLLPGHRLPPIRQLADQLEVAPGTVARAYAQLESAGTVDTDRARGTFVATASRVGSNARRAEVRKLLRPAVVAAFHMGSSADELTNALAEAMADIYPARS